MIAAWADRYVERDSPPATEAGEAPRNVVVQETRKSKFNQAISAGRIAGGRRAGRGRRHDAGPGPYDLLLAGLGACTSMTMRLYADLKSLPLDRVAVR